VAIWNSDAFCVRYLRTFRAMPWPSKLLDISGGLAPLGITWIAYVYRTDGYAGLPILRYCWSFLTILYWLGYVGVMSNYVRGYLAQRRGVRPATPGRKPKLAYLKRYSMIFGAIACMFALLIYLMSMRRSIHGTRGLWASDVLFLVFFYQNISTYTRNRFWNAPLDSPSSTPALT
jgi:hypothetical protein